MSDVTMADPIAAILARLRPYVSADDVEITDVAALAHMIADRAADDVAPDSREAIKAAFLERWRRIIATAEQRT